MAVMKFGVAVLALIAVSGCGVVQKVRATGAAALGKGVAAPVQIRQIPRAQIEKAGQPILYARVMARGNEVLLQKIVQRGDYSLWRSSDGLQMAFRDGSVAQTWGFGGDLMSAATPPAGHIASGGRYSRSIFAIGAEDRVERFDFQCEAQPKGAEDVTVFQRSYRTLHVTETCRGPAGSVVNEYWMDGGIIRKSQQWAGNFLGHIEVQRIVD